MQAFRSRLQALQRSEFVRSVGVLVGGAALGQAVMVLVLPILTRLYSPADFNAFAVYASLLGIVSTIACLRLEIAIPLAESDEDATKLLALALLSTTAVAVILSIAVWLLADKVSVLIGEPDLSQYLWLLPVGVWLSGLYSALQYTATRNKQFSSVALTRITQGIGGGGTQVLLGWLGMAPLGLLLGHVVYRAAGIVKLATNAAVANYTPASLLKCRHLSTTLRKYQRFPKISTLEILANVGAMELPVLIIAATAIGPEAGFILLAMRVMQAPMSLIGGAVSHVYLSRALKEIQHGSLPHFTMKVVSGLSRVGVGPIVFVGIIAPSVFPIVFGKEWERAGEIVSWMTPWFVMQFLSSPVSMALQATWSQRIALLVHSLGLMLRVGVVVAVVHVKPDSASEAYAISGFMFYTVYLLVIARTVAASPGMLLRALMSGAKPVTMWLAGALAAWSVVDSLTRIA